MMVCPVRRSTAAALVAGGLLLPACLAGCSTPETELSPSEWIEQNPTVFGKLKSYDEEERRDAVARLKALGRDQGTAVIYWVLSDRTLDDYRLEVILARILADWKDPRAVPYLLENLESPDDGAVRIASEGLLIFGDSPEVMETLEELLESEADQPRSAAVDLLAGIGTRRTIEMLGERINRELNPEIRARMVIAVISSRNPRRLEFLIDALNDNDPAIRELAWVEVQKYRQVPDVEYSPRAPDKERAQAVGALRVWLRNMQARRGGLR